SSAFLSAVSRSNASTFGGASTQPFGRSSESKIFASTAPSLRRYIQVGLPIDRSKRKGESRSPPLFHQLLAIRAASCGRIVLYPYRTSIRQGNLSLLMS